MLEQRPRRRRFAEAVDADDRAVETDVLAPVVGDAGLHRDPRHAPWQDLVAIRGILAIEHAGAGHRYDPGGDTLVTKRLACAHGERNFGAGGDDERPAHSRLVPIREHITAAA